MESRARLNLRLLVDAARQKHHPSFRSDILRHIFHSPAHATVDHNIVNSTIHIGHRTSSFCTSPATLDDGITSLITLSLINALASIRTDALHGIRCLGRSSSVESRPAAKARNDVPELLYGSTKRLVYVTLRVRVVQQTMCGVKLIF